MTFNPLTGSTMDSFLKEENIEPKAKPIESIEDSTTKVDAAPAILEDQAAKAFSELMPIWKKLRKSMNYGAFERVSTAILEFPLADVYPKFKNDQELQAFKIGCTIMDAKNIMISSTYNKRFKENKQEGTPSENNEEKNG